MANITSSFNMQTSILTLLLLLLSTQSSATSGSITDRFIQCLQDRADPSFPITGELYTPGNSSFPTVLQNYIRNLRFNETTTPKPFLIITAEHVSHIQAAVVCGKQNRLLLKTRSGGHDYEGLSYLTNTNQPFFIVDMFNLRSVNVDIEQETAWVQAGATLGEVYYRIAEKSNKHGFPAGVCPTVGVGGHFSGGGYGNLMRKYGLSVDNIVDAQIIDVNGKLLDRKNMGEDLFWAITGGGGVSFGVVLAYKIKLVRVPEVVTVFTIERREEQNLSTIAERWVQVADKLDRDLFLRMTFSVINDTNGGKTVRAIFPTLYLGNSRNLVTLLNKDFPELGLQESDCTEMSWVESVLYYTGFPSGTPTTALLSRTPQRLNPFKIKSDYVQNPISKRQFEFIFERMKELENQMLAFNPYGGRMSEISEFAKPFPHRSGNIAKIQYEVNWEDLSDEAENRYLNFTRLMYDYMTPFVSKNPREAFLNYRDLDIGINSHGRNAYTEGMVYGHKYFKETNYKRLVSVKTKVDPDNFFRNEQSIPTLSS
ncbi:putative tetrahydroberberine oxidase [Helianthus annuus]|uniref:Tetrahydroberberine oxidase n=1 Tax=Helianthus annuus TaxID=4232 RepID=A0A9K3EIF7_HELAN|nr:berberine bridge enzyme-like 8 [Helianthus annuus]KAF5774082.1 putative tetrahydroberberine oxidase [Helianthus annuus]KAJ0477478.1 putative tetrahydroberberine oxidase [Helianthus annuus]KAJ0481955.1 putative tetrahydroberberine oxidase [Helianthus annuus]KAJ0498310.1 putative tetrahydroberberine oxidase [Helianthus annuus]KAJ0664320.1 putative tetrahydroberberine oxidase [Helianthus annuus]